MSALHINQCGTVCELHWFETDPEHIHQPPMTLADEAMLDSRRIEWTLDGAPEAKTRLEAFTADNPRSQLYLFMSGLTRTEVRQMIEAVRKDGDSEALDYPLGYLVETIRSMDDEAAAEAWELYGQGLRP